MFFFFEGRGVVSFVCVAVVWRSFGGRLEGRERRLNESVNAGFYEF